MSYQFANALFDTSDQTLNAAWYEMLNLGNLDNEQLEGLTARHLYDELVKDVSAPEITVAGSGEAVEIDKEDHVSAIQEVLDEERESRIHYRAELQVAGEQHAQIIDIDSDWDEVADSAWQHARDALNPDTAEPVWCGADAWHPASDGAQPMGGYKSSPDQGGGGPATVIYKVRP